jgi:hypothetical protein
MGLRAEPRRFEDTAAAPAEPAPRRVGWFAAIRAGIYCLIMTTLGLLAGIMIGVRTGLFPSQSLAVGAALGLLLGWQAALASLRANGWALLPPRIARIASAGRLDARITDRGNALSRLFHRRDHGNRRRGASAVFLGDRRRGRTDGDHSRRDENAQGHAALSQPSEPVSTG